MFSLRAKCSHLFKDCWWKTDKSEDRDGDSGREAENRGKRRRMKREENPGQYPGLRGEREEGRRRMSGWRFG